MKFIVLVLATLSLFFGCGSDGGRKRVRAKINKDQVKYTPQINALLSEQNYSEALIKIAEWKERDPGISKAPWLMVYEGRALLGVGNLKAASDVFKKVLSYGSVASPVYIGLSNYNLSFVAEILGNDTKVISILFGAKKWSGSLPNSISDVEIPVRLASAYMRVGNEVEARKHFDLADKGIKKLRGKVGRGRGSDLRLAKIYYSAGNLGDVRLNSRNVESYLMAFSRSQKYLLMSAESGEEPWSSQASNEIRNAYNQFWASLRELKAPLKGKDKGLQKRKSQERQVATALALSHALEDLEAMIVDDELSNERLKGLKLFIKSFSTKLDKFILERPKGEGLTEAAQKREGLRREGRGVPVPAQSKKLESKENE